jgi:hypothetical protein
MDLAVPTRHALIFDFATLGEILAAAAQPEAP